MRMKYIQFFLLLTGIMILPVNGLSLTRDIHVEWEYQQYDSLAGFRLYLEEDPVCETTDSSATAMNCTIDAPDGESTFTLASFFQDGTESPKSATYSYIFSSELLAVLEADTLTGESPLTISFDATSSTGNIVSYEWMFGDGDSGSGNITNHTFTAAGNYIVTLTVNDVTGAYDQETVSVTVTSPTASNTPPQAVISSSATVGDVPLQVDFDGAGSYDSEGTIVTYRWDMGDGGIEYGPQITYTYSSAGTFSATLTVTDEGGLTDSISTPVIVNASPGEDNIPPNAIITASTSRGYAPLSVTFDAAQSVDPDGQINSYTWNFGDGSTGTGVSTTHSYTQPAVYTVTLRVTDNMGNNSQIASHTVTVLDPDTITVPEPEGTIQTLQAIYYLLLNSSTEDQTSQETNPVDDN